MEKEKNFKVLGELKEALESVPERYRAAVSKALVHDIGIIARTIDMIAEQRVSA